MVAPVSIYSDPRYAQQRFQEAQYWASDPTGLNWTSWGRKEAHEELLAAEMSLILTQAHSEGRPLRSDEIQRLNELQDSIDKGRLDQINLTVHQPGTREFYLFSQQRDNLSDRQRLEGMISQLNNMRGNGNNNLFGETQQQVERPQVPEWVLAQIEEFKKEGLIAQPP